jgi:molybdopterin-biosynthesis enzyme MoeA-like protein
MLAANCDSTQTFLRGMPQPSDTLPNRMGAALLLIGNELLSGKVTEANMRPLTQVLRSRGIALTRVVVVPDEIGTIEREIRALRDTHSMLFTSGGVGPTHDDVTIESVANAYDTTVFEHPLLAAMIARRYGDRCSPEHLRMARVPRGTTLEASAGSITGDTGFALAEWPAMRMHDTWILPGVPEAFRMKLSIIAAVLARDPQCKPFSSQAVYLTLDEPELVAYLETVVRAYPEVEVGSYPKWFDETYRTKVTFDGSSDTRVGEAARSFCQSLPEGCVVREEGSARETV